MNPFYEYTSVAQIAWHAWHNWADPAPNQTGAGRRDGDFVPAERDFAADQIAGATGRANPARCSAEPLADLLSIRYLGGSWIWTAGLRCIAFDFPRVSIESL